MKPMDLVGDARQFMLNNETTPLIGRRAIVVTAHVAAVHAVESAGLNLGQMFDLAKRFALATTCASPQHPPTTSDSWQDFMRSLLVQLTVQMLMREPEIQALELQRQNL